MSHLTHTIEHGIATIILDRPPQNRIGDQMVDELATAINAIERSDARVVLVRPTRAHAAHKALLRAWANGGVQTADDVMFNIAMPLFETEDAKHGLASAVQALKAGTPRPVLEFKGR